MGRTLPLASIPAVEPSVGNRIASRATALAVRFLARALLILPVVSSVAGCGAATRFQAYRAVQQGRAAFDREAYPEARTHLLEAMRIDPEYTSGWYNYGLLALEMKQPQAAAELFTGVLAREPDDYRAAHQLGIAELRQGHLRQAERALRRALEIEPEHAPSYYALGLVYEKEGRLDLARSCYLRAYRVWPDWAPLRERIARLDRSA